MKAGYKTSEFYVTIVSLVVGLGVTSGLIVPEQAQKLNDSLVQIIGLLITLGPVITYILSRTYLKKQEIVRGGGN